jgi:hypothetical protein
MKRQRRAVTAVRRASCDTMTNRRVIHVLLLGTIACGSASPRATCAPGSEQSSRTHLAAIKLGMTRNDLLKFFTVEGGLSTGLQRTFVSRDCRYFKIDVEFEAVGRPSRDRDGRATLIEDGRDIIIKISKPYLEFSVID